MANAVLTPQMVAREALAILNNELVMAKTIYRGYEGEFGATPNGYKIGSTINVRRPNKASTRVGAVASPQDVVEGSTPIVVNTQRGYDFRFTTQELSLNMNQLSERVIRPAMVRLANDIDVDIYNTAYRAVWNWVYTTPPTTSGTPIGTIPNFLKGPQRLDEMAVMSDSRSAALTPADYYGMVGGLTASYVSPIAATAIERAKLPTIGNVMPYQTQNVQNLVTGLRGGAPVVNGAGQVRTNGGDPTVASNNVNNTASSGTLVKDVNQQTFLISGMTASVATWGVAGDVFTIAGVYAVNPVTKATLPYLQQFVIINAFGSDGSGNATVTIAPAIITSGAFQTVSAAPANSAALTFVASANGTIQQNLVFHKNAFALVMVPMEIPVGVPPGATRESFDGISVRLIPYYDGINDIGNWRLDVLYGVKALYPDLATRING